MAKPQDVTGAGSSQEEAPAAVDLRDDASWVEPGRLPLNAAWLYQEFRGEI